MSPNARMSYVLTYVHFNCYYKFSIFVLYGQAGIRDRQGWDGAAVPVPSLPSQHACMLKVEMKRDHVSTFPLNSTVLE